MILIILSLINDEMIVLPPINPAEVTAHEVHSLRVIWMNGDNSRSTFKNQQLINQEKELCTIFMVWSIPHFDAGIQRDYLGLSWLWFLSELIRIFFWHFFFKNKTKQNNHAEYKSSQGVEQWLSSSARWIASSSGRVSSSSWLRIRVCCSQILGLLQT